MKSEELVLMKRYLMIGEDPISVPFLSRKGISIYRVTLDYLEKRYGEKTTILNHRRHFYKSKHSVVGDMLDAGGGVVAIKGWLGHAHIGSIVSVPHLTSEFRDAMHQRIFASRKAV